ncbi:MAG: hypothetical protein ACE5HT_14450 [Gemmatimonadales bacterium]
MGTYGVEDVGRRGRLRHCRVLALLPLLALGACISPTDRSDNLIVEFSDIPQLVVNDTVQLSAEVLEDNGSPVPNAEIVFSGDNANVLNVSSTGRLLAVGAGDATVSATAIGFSDTPVATLQVRVRDLLEIDSIRPVQVRYGETVQIFGVGLDPGFLFLANFGGVETPVESFTPQDPAKPTRFGTLSLWVTPPASPKANAILLGLEGLVFSPPEDTVRVFQRDLYEPNDTTASSVSLPFFNPALAFERVRRGENQLAVDWYTFTTTTPGDWTVTAWAPRGGSNFNVYVTNALAWSRAAFDALGFGVYSSTGWSVGSGFRACDGLGFIFPKANETGFTFEAPPDSAVMAFKDLPAGTYHVFVTYGEGGAFFDAPTKVAGLAVFVDSLNIPQPLPAGLTIAPGYNSVLPPDQFEENDYCTVAADLTVPGTLNATSTVRSLTIDSPHDADWFKFTVGGTGAAVQFTLAVADSVADLDLYVVRDFRPDSLVLVDFGIGGGVANQTVGAFLDPGQYFLVVADFFGIPTEYELTSDVLSVVRPPVPAAAVRSASVRSRLDRAAARRRGTRPKIR